MHQSYLSLLGMAAFTNALGPDVLNMLGGLPVGNKHSGVATQQAAALTTAAAKLPVTAVAHDLDHVEEKTEVVEDFTRIYISSGTEVVEMATTTLYYPLNLCDAGTPSPTALPTGALPADNLPADNLPVDTMPTHNLPVLGGLGGGLPIKRDSSSATGASGGFEHHEWAPMEEEFPQEAFPEERTATSSIIELRTTTSALVIATPAVPAVPAVPAPAPASPLGNLPVLGGLGGGLPIKRDSSSATGAGSSENEWDEDEDSHSATGASGGSEHHEWAPMEEEEPHFFAQTSTAVALSPTFSTQLVLPTPAVPAVGAPAPASPLGNLPVLGGLGGGLPIKRTSPEHEDSKLPEAATTFVTAVRSSVTTSAIALNTPAPANPLGSLPVLGGLTGGLGGLKARQAPDAAAIQSLAQQASQAAVQAAVASAVSASAQAALASATRAAAGAIASATQRAAAETKAASPVQGLPVIGGLSGGLGGI
ncbi:hypothetical protein CLAFUW4_06750 [Fulvia fulva]|uniref:Uncharacterized protein n=1 Tax=Passalora fulva TaxID=5499 RepID=A0A9Q8PAU4_PASFU|nr:uncharacterized protein CLAFUR5_06887 [Fulvia fulva]KAK4621227.1 hypothetical protein CLAFUR4_06758 [Fulvia fulva]KAK4622488.1 hypothetical protein CLAFUR0_06753 [Fulvia fulva]UJO19072.1 hypothetical protein CLAFUR5_06887 [Fulvia fulva]WPV15829.1 hypothetical protein CLAFUW4_06750 [Fulvia fulva]WPV31223.1 hypothetical protein CLAFUW7_06749 [Fulvia fulva]